ncbi:MAG: polysaccharide biosynthesis/export family protein [Bryobacteraceae bacterium]
MKRLFLSLLICVGLVSALPAQTAGSGLDAPYVIGVDDSLTIHVADIEDYSTTPFVVDMRGNVTLPKVGRIHVAGLTADQLESVMSQKLKEYLQNPDVQVVVTQFHTLPVSVLGEVGAPGVQQIRGTKTLLEVILAAGGLKVDAGKNVTITRRMEEGPIPIANAKANEASGFYVAEVPTAEVSTPTTTAANLEIKGRDVITVSKGELVYIIGAVKKPGGYVLGGNTTLTVLKAMAMSDGLERGASAKHARILRPKTDTTREEIQIDLQKIMSSRAADVPLQPEDILFVPTSASRNIAIRTAEAAIQVGTGLALYSVRF